MPVVNSVEEEIMKEMSADMDIPYNMIKDVVINGQSGFTKKVMEDGNYNSIRWPKFGVFKLKHKHMLIKKHMIGMNKIQQSLYRSKVINGKIFKDKK